MASAARIPMAATSPSSPPSPIIPTRGTNPTTRARSRTSISMPATSRGACGSSRDARLSPDRRECAALVPALRQPGSRVDRARQDQSADAQPRCFRDAGLRLRDARHRSDEGQRLSRRMGSGTAWAGQQCVRLFLRPDEVPIDTPRTCCRSTTATCRADRTTGNFRRAAPTIGASPSRARRAITGCNGCSASPTTASVSDGELVRRKPGLNGGFRSPQQPRQSMHPGRSIAAGLDCMTRASAIVTGCSPEQKPRNVRGESVSVRSLLAGALRWRMGRRTGLSGQADPGHCLVRRPAVSATFSCARSAKS